MHTFKVVDEETGAVAIFNYNGDYSGNAIVDVLDAETGNPTTINIPCRSLFKFTAVMVASRKIAALEQADYMDVLLGTDLTPNAHTG